MKPQVLFFDAVHEAIPAAFVRGAALAAAGLEETTEWK
jgi:hypothetical protein